VNRASPNPAFFDPTWLFLVAGVALLAATVLVAAQDDVDEANHLRDQVLAVEQHRETRLNNYREFLAALDEKQPALVQSRAMDDTGYVQPTYKQLRAVRAKTHGARRGGREVPHGGRRLTPSRS
jgi:hypothetical protein